MDLTLDTSQRELRDAVARYCADRFGLGDLGAREVAVSTAGFDRGVWRELADLGVLGMLVPEADGGTGLGVAAAVIAFDQLGRQLAPGVPGPVLWSVLAAPMLSRSDPGERLVGGLDLAGALDPSHVEHLDDLDDLLVLRADGVFLCPAAGLASGPAPTALDPLIPVGRLDALPAGERIGDAAAAAHLRTVGTVLSAALAVGVAAAALEVARLYALDRHQFGVPIGSFQAVKHLLADMYVRTTLAASATRTAGTVVDEAAGDPPLAAAGAKLLAGEAAVTNARTAVQILGGMGFTWEMPPNYLLKRALLLERTFGSAKAHALRIGTALI